MTDVAYVKLKEANCYAWAVGYHTAIDPGGFSGRKYGSNSDINLRSAAVRDGLISWQLNTVPPARNGYYVVALIASDDDQTAYHWIRRDSDVQWSHKPGQGSVSYKDAAGTTLTDNHPPHLANWNYETNFTGKKSGLLPMAKAQGWGTNYNRFVGYFYCPDGGLQVAESTGCCTIM